MSALKRSTLPRIIYILHTVPITPPQSFFKCLRKAFVVFVWNDRRPRLAYEILCRSKLEGGVGLPDVVLYYKAMALMHILNWCHDSSNKMRVSLEKTMAGRNLVGAPWTPTITRSLSDWTSPLTRNSLSVWDKLNKSGKYAPQISPLAPLEGYPWKERLIQFNNGSQTMGVCDQRPT